MCLSFDIDNSEIIEKVVIGKREIYLIKKKVDTNILSAPCYYYEYYVLVFDPGTSFILFNKCFFFEENAYKSFYKKIIKHCRTRIRCI